MYSRALLLVVTLWSCSSFNLLLPSPRPSRSTALRATRRSFINDALVAPSFVTAVAALAPAQALAGESEATAAGVNIVKSKKGDGPKPDVGEVGGCECESVGPTLNHL